MDNLKTYHNFQRTEEVQSIIERMPTRFGFWVSAIVLLIFLFLMTFGWLIRYPDVVVGEIVVNTTVSPIKLMANSSGKLQLGDFESLDVVEEGSIIASIQNPTAVPHLLMVDKVLKNYDPTADHNTDILTQLPNKLTLGELTPKYYSFINSLQQLHSFKVNKLYEKQLENLSLLVKEQEKSVLSMEKKLSMSKENLGFIYKFFKRDSTLFLKKVLSEADFDKTKMSYLNGKDNYQSSLGALINNKEQAQQTLNKIQEVEIQKSDKSKDLKLSLITTYNDLVDNIHAWQEKYLFRAPFKGKVQFLKFWTNNHFVESKEPVFTIIPKDDVPYGQLALPAMGAGKVKIGQEVIVKLENFPYAEYGSIKGRITSISLTTNTKSTQKGEMEIYLATVEFKDGLITNYGKKLDFKFESKGSAEIITKDRRFIERLFDNLSYALNK